MGRVIGEIVASLSVNEDIQAFAIEQEPGDEASEFAGWECNLIHGLRVRANREIMPAPEPPELRA
jgi:hypothetical protein